MSDQVIAEIERSVDDFTARVGEQVLAIYAGNGLWLISAHMRGLRVQNPDVMAALREFDARLQKMADRDAALARTLGLEAAE
jgi:hypothetical protein